MLQSWQSTFLLNLEAVTVSLSKRSFDSGKRA